MEQVDDLGEKVIAATPAQYLDGAGCEDAVGKLWGQAYDSRFEAMVALEALCNVMRAKTNVTQPSPAAGFSEDEAGDVAAPDCEKVKSGEGES